MRPLRYKIDTHSSDSNDKMPLGTSQSLNKYNQKHDSVFATLGQLKAENKTEKVTN